ncbi:MAG: hypothetical protein D4S01_01370 [Dehalococcoidia bacterium]|nr:MAG: hypothetical protein D4S01_01370 [Dehalococcoidia bacterium]
MAKINKEKWHQSWFYDLSTESKLFYCFLWDIVDSAGCWKIDGNEVKSTLRLPAMSVDACVKELIDANVARLVEVEDKSYVWLTEYCLQYHTLSEKYNGHRMAIRLLRFYGLFDEPVIKSLFRDGYQFTVDKARKKLKLDVNDREQPGERDMFNTVTDLGIPLSWQDWRRLCQLCPKMDKRQVFESIAEFVPIYLPNHIKTADSPEKVMTNLAHPWLMFVDIAEYSEKGKIYSSPRAESLLGKWRDEGNACKKKYSQKPI